MPNVEIYGSPNSTFVRTARLACEEKGVPHEMRQVGENDFSDLKKPDHLKRHPFGKIPAMQHGDVTVFESIAICRYIDEAFGGPALQPADAIERARMTQWTSAINDNLVPTMLRGYIAAIFAPPGLDVETDEEKLNAFRATIHDHIRILDAALDGRTFIAGDNISIADFLLTPILHYLGNTLDGMRFFEGRDNIGRWWDAVSTRPSFKNTVPPFLAKETEAA